METDKKNELAAAVKNNILDYLNDQLRINEAAIKAYDNDNIIDQDVQTLRDIEAIKIRDQIEQLKRHIDHIKNNL